MSGIRATVFGLDVQVDRALPFLETVAARPTGRGLEISLAASVEELDWPGDAELIFDQRHPDGAVSYQIEVSSESAYRIWGPEYGASILSGDGRRLQGAPGSGGMPTWQRMLIAQALPFAAVLNGLEVLHASAVTIGKGAVAFVGWSGSGKTSLALALCRRGAGFLTDDVLAVERMGDKLIGHPGTPVVGLDHAEADRLYRVEGVEEREVLAVNPRERVTRMQVSAKPVPLQALFFLDRQPDGPSVPCFESAADAQMLLAATFNFVLADSQRLASLLDVCALAARGVVERIVAGPGVNASELGIAVEHRIGAFP